MSQSPSSLDKLSGEQRRVLEWRTAGQTTLAVATAAGVGWTTVYRWMNADPHFLAAYNQWQADVLATAKARPVAATDVAVTAVVGSMAKGDAKTAMALLKQFGLLRSPKPGQVDPDLVAQHQRAERGGTGCRPSTTARPPSSAGRRSGGDASHGSRPVQTHARLRRR